MSIRDNLKELKPLIRILLVIEPQLKVILDSQQLWASGTLTLTSEVINKGVMLLKLKTSTFRKGVVEKKEVKIIRNFLKL